MVKAKKIEIFIIYMIYNKKHYYQVLLSISVIFKPQLQSVSQTTSSSMEHKEPERKESVLGQESIFSGQTALKKIPRPYPIGKGIGQPQRQYPQGPFIQGPFIQGPFTQGQYPQGPFTPQVQYPKGQPQVQYPQGQPQVQYPKGPFTPQVQYPQGQPQVQYPKGQPQVQYPKGQPQVQYPQVQSKGPFNPKSTQGSFTQGQSAFTKAIEEATSIAVKKVMQQFGYEGPSYEGSSQVSSKKPCLFHAQGKCTFGDNCKNSHDSPPVSQKPQTVCNKFTEGTCTYGSNCRFLHVTYNSPQTPSQVVKDSDRVCKYFIKGECRNGSACEFIHQVLIPPQ